MITLKIPAKLWSERSLFVRSGIVTILIFALVIAVVPLPDPPFADDYSTVLLDKSGKVLRVFLNSNDQWCMPPQFNREIPEKLKQAVLHYEDRWYFWHPGVNPVSLLRAFSQNLRAGQIVSGGSTITMQVARLIEPKPRTYSNKFLEILQAIKLECFYSKKTLLKMYLGHAPYGGNIVGYQAASLRYFQKLPDALTWSEAAVLAVLPNAPGLISPLADTQQLRIKRDRLLKNLNAAGILDGETLQLALMEAIPQQSFATPMLIPHLSRRLADKHPGETIKTTIDADLQRFVAERVKQHSLKLQTYGIENAAALVADTRSGAVYAYVGSQDFFTDQVDGVQAARSSGSVLKPFLYALSMDEGLILPIALLNDIPTYYGAFSPANADMAYRGVVTAHQALTRSLNVPAVRLLNKFGLFNFYTFLKQAGVSTLFRPAARYGLPLILGGAEIRLWEVAALYRGLANGGRSGALHVIQDPQNDEINTAQLISPAAAYMVLQILNDVKRPGAEYYWRQYQNQWPLAWKTGTSYGQRDAWAFGVSPQWTIAVWAGNFNGAGNANLSGAASAGPLLFDIFNSLPRDDSQRWFKAPETDMIDREVCVQSGFTAGPDCPQTKWVMTPLHMKVMEPCPYHKLIFVNEDASREVCSLCWEDAHYRTERVLCFPPDVSQYLRENGQVVETVPPHQEHCPALAGIQPMRITYPQNNAALWIPSDLGGIRQKISMRVAHQQKNRRVFWYLNDYYQGSSQDKHVIAVDVPQGWHELEVVDDTGFRTSVRFLVRDRSSN